MWQITFKSDKRKEKKLFFREGEVGKGCYKQNVYWRKLGVHSMVNFHWLSCESLWLVELLPGKEKFFLPPAEGSKVCYFLLEMQGSSLLVGICIVREWYLSERFTYFLYLLLRFSIWMRIPPSGLLAPWTEEPHGLHTVHGVAELDTSEWLTLLLLHSH